MFEVLNACYETAGARLLEPVSLTVKEGQIVGLIGPNGAGKSTLLKLLAGQLPPTSGAVRLDGRSLAHWGRRAFACRVAYLAQYLPATDDLTVAELVRFGRYPWRGLLGRMTAQDDDRIDQAMALTHVDALADRKVDTLSGGERQRAWLAMLLAQESRYLLLDEPLAALDVAHQVDVMGLVWRLGRELGLGVVVIMHDINMASRYCDHLVALRGGRVLAQGHPQHLVQEEQLAAIYGIPMQVLAHPTHRHAIAVAQ